MVINDYYKKYIYFPFSMQKIVFCIVRSNTFIASVNIIKLRSFISIDNLKPFGNYLVHELVLLLDEEVPYLS